MDRQPSRLRIPGCSFVPRKVVIDLLQKDTALTFQAIELLSGDISGINFLRDFALAVRQFARNHALCGEIDFRDAGGFMLLFDFALTAYLR